MQPIRIAALNCNLAYARAFAFLLNTRSISPRNSHLRHTDKRIIIVIISPIIHRRRTAVMSSPTCATTGWMRFFTRRAPEKITSLGLLFQAAFEQREWVFQSTTTTKNLISAESGRLPLRIRQTIKTTLKQFFFFFVGMGRDKSR